MTTAYSNISYLMMRLLMDQMFQPRTFWAKRFRNDSYSSIAVSLGQTVEHSHGGIGLRPEIRFKADAPCAASRDGPRSGRSEMRSPYP